MLHDIYEAGCVCIDKGTKDVVGYKGGGFFQAVDSISLCLSGLCITQSSCNVIKKGAESFDC